MTAPASAALTPKQHAHLAEARAALTAIIVAVEFKKTNLTERNLIVTAWSSLEQIVERAAFPFRGEDTTP